MADIKHIFDWRWKTVPSTMFLAFPAWKDRTP